MKKFLVIDSNALLHRAFHALPPLTTKKGEPTSAIYGFLLILFKAIKDLNPDYIAACFDLPAPTFRHKKFEEYKATRPKTPDEIKSQLPKTRELLSVFNIPVFVKEGFEADDIIATLSTRAENENKNLETYILTGDMDTLQLVDDNTKVYGMGRGIKDTIIYDKAKVIEKCGVEPEKVVDLKALIGDASDNIPGVEGIGKKTGADLIKEFGSLDNVYQQAEAGNDKIKERIRELLKTNKVNAYLSKELAEVDKKVEIDFDIDKCRFGNFDEKKVQQALADFEFTTLVNRIPSLKKAEVKPVQKLLI